MEVIVLIVRPFLPSTVVVVLARLVGTRTSVLDVSVLSKATSPMLMRLGISKGVTFQVEEVP